MSNRFIQLNMEDGSSLFIQSVQINQGGEKLASGADVIKAADCIDKALPAVTEFCQKTKKSIGERLNPDEINLEFSVSFTADMSAVIASAGAEAGITVKLVWKKAKK